MKTNKISILTYHDKFFGQTRKPWTSLDADKMKQALESEGFSVKLYEIHEIINNPGLVKGTIVFYTFHQKTNRRQYIKDLIHILDDGNQIIIPSYDLLNCHEDKGFQELYKRKIGLPSLKSIYLSSYKELSHYQIQYPVVLKTVDRSNAKGVHLIQDEKQLVKMIQRLDTTSISRRLDLVRRKYFRGKRSYPGYPEYSNKTDYITFRDYILKERNFILQEFLPDLQYDYRVTILYDQYLVTRRLVRDNDFRASGAKKFRFDFETPTALLNYAKKTYGYFDTPIISFDIAEYGGKFHLLEYQALHFGINVVKKGKGYFIQKFGRWQFIEEKVDFETAMGKALAKYICHRFKK